MSPCWPPVSLASRAGCGTWQALGPRCRLKNQGLLWARPRALPLAHVGTSHLSTESLREVLSPRLADEEVEAQRGRATGPGHTAGEQQGEVQT